MGFNLLKIEPVLCRIGVVVCSLTLVFACGAAERTEVARPITFEPQPGQIVIRAGDKPLATYVYEDPQIRRPYFKDICAPTGVQVTRHHPPREGIDPTDHAELHPGLWLAFGDISGADFWRNKATVAHAGFVQAPYSREGQAGFAVRNRYVANAGANHHSPLLCEEVCAYTFLVRPAGYLLLWDSTFRSEQSAFYFGDQEEMGLGVRMATPIMVKAGKGGRMLDSEGRKNEKGIWGKPALWCDYGGRLDGTFAGIAILPDPGNFRPCRWHARDYGFMAANPFGLACFDAGPPSKVEVAAGRTFRLRFGILIHAADDETGTDLHAAYQDYVTVSKSIRDSGLTDE